MSLLEIFGAVVRHPDFAAPVFPDQCLQGQVNSDRGRSHHDGRAALRAAEQNELRGVHLQADFLSFAAVIDTAKYREPFLFQHGFDALEGFGNRVRTADVLHSVVWSWSGSHRALNGPGSLTIDAWRRSDDKRKAFVAVCSNGPQPRSLPQRDFRMKQARLCRGNR